MKKYIAPTSKYINLASEGSLMTNSKLDIGGGSVDGNDIDTRKQDFVNTPWDDWSE